MREKSAGPIVRSGVVGWLKDPQVAMTDSEKLPARVPAGAFTDSIVVTVPEPGTATLAGLKDATAPVGTPETEKFAVPQEPFRVVREIV